MRRVLGGVPDAPGGERGWRGPAVHRWQHGTLHDVVAPMREHVVMAYQDTPRRIERTAGRARVRSVTTNDTVTVIPAGQTARWDIDGALDVVHVYLAPEYLTRVAEAVGEAASVAEPRDAVAAPHPRLATLVRLLARELDRPGVTDTLHADARAELVALELLRPTTGRQPAGTVLPTPATTGAGLTRWQVRRVMEYMDAHLDRALGLAELAALLDLSPKHFCTAFRRATGLPPHAWLQRHRIARAEALLRATGAPVTDLAVRLGYASHSAFTAAFRRATGRTPSAWRREHGPG